MKIAFECAQGIDSWCLAIYQKVNGNKLIARLLSIPSNITEKLTVGYGMEIFLFVFLLKRH